ncbi:MAG: orotate phosphoribosyltransferase [Nitrososphaerales archaeon]|jgi:orotate phosphoribosyltransferase
MAWKTRRSQISALAEGLVKAGALQFGTFTLPDGRESSYYINLRGISSYPGLYNLAFDSMSRLVSGKAPKVKVICGVPISGLALAAPIALSLKKPLIYARSSRQGSGRIIEGEVRPGWKVIVVDDLSTTGKTILASAKAVQEEGGEVSDAAVLVDRMEGARERLSKEGIALHCMTDVMELADTLFSMELIGPGDLKAITRSVGNRQ